MDLRDALDIPVPAIVLAEGEFGEPAGKTANGVVMHSEIFEPVAIVDSETAGQSPRDILERPSVPEVPIVAEIDEALDVNPSPEALVIGVAPAGGELPTDWVDGIQTAMRAGCDVVSGLHTFLGDDPTWTTLAQECDVRLFDVRKPPAAEDLRVADGSVDELDTPVALTLGTDCAVGKRTTTFELYRAAKQRGLDAGWVATGQTGIMVGAHRGTVVDRVPSDFTAGIVEQHVIDVANDHDIVFVEGQGALTHRAYSGVTLSILHGAWPDAVVLVDDPTRERRVLFEQFPIAGVDTERELITALSEASVPAVSTWGDPAVESERYDVPVANVFEVDGADRLLDAVLEDIDQ